MKTYKVAICRFPGTGSEHHSCVDWLIQVSLEMSRDPAIEHVELITESDTPITMTRNRAVRKALDSGCDYILMVDSDMAPDYRVGTDPTARPFWATAWGWMLRRREAEGKAADDHARHARSQTELSELEIHQEVKQQSLAEFPPATIAAPYCGPPPEENVYIFRWATKESHNPNPDFRLEMIGREDAAMRAGIEEVAALPTGLILYDARVFKELPPPWFEYEYEDRYQSEKATTEDVFQTRNASLIGLPQYVAWDCWAAHIKPKVVGKPTVITKDQVHGTLAEAVLKGRDARRRLTFVSPHDGPARELPRRRPDNDIIAHPRHRPARETPPPTELFPSETHP